MEIKKEKIKVTDKEVDEEIKSLSDKYGMKEEDLLKAIGSKEMIKYDLEMRKVIEVLKEADKVRELLGTDGNVIVRKSGTEPLIKVKIMGANYDEICNLNAQIREKFAKYDIAKVRVVK